MFDRVLAAVSPARAVRRAEARARLARVNQVKNLYEAAASGRRTGHWRVSGSDANTEIGGGLSRVRDVARDMVRNNAYAERAKATITHNVIGTGIVPRIEGNDRAVELIKRHIETTDIDADGRHNLYGLQELCMASIVESGEVLVRYRPRKTMDGFALPFQLQVLESDYLDQSKNGPLPNGNFAVQGIEFDLVGRRVAYWIFDQHPGSVGYMTGGALQSQRRSADFISHIYRVDRPGQARGVSWFAPVVLRMRDFADYTDAQLIRQKIAACFAAFVTTPEGATMDGGITSTGTPIEVFEPGMIERLREGETVTFTNPPATTDFDAYSKATLREIAAGLGVTYEAMTGDLTGVNYSSGRMGWLEYQRNIDAWRWNMFIPQMLGAVERWAVQGAQATLGDTSEIRISWTPPRREMIDPVTEIEAAKTAIRSGLSTRSEEIRRLGYDPEEMDREAAIDAHRADELELVFDSDPRKVTTRGVAQKSADPNAPDAVDASGGGDRGN